MKYFLLAIDKYSDFEGRTTRKEYWYWMLFYFLFFLWAHFLDGLLDHFFDVGEIITGYGPMALFYLIMSFLPSLSASVRRLHDTGRTGWWVLVGLIPLVGWICLLVLLLLETKPTWKYNPVEPEPEKDPFII